MALRYMTLFAQLSRNVIKRMYMNDNTVLQTLINFMDSNSIDNVQTTQTVSGKSGEYKVTVYIEEKGEDE